MSRISMNGNCQIITLISTFPVWPLPTETILFCSHDFPNTKAPQKSGGRRKSFQED